MLNVWIKTFLCYVSSCDSNKWQEECNCLKSYITYNFPLFNLSTTEAFKVCYRLQPSLFFLSVFCDLLKSVPNCDHYPSIVWYTVPFVVPVTLNFGLIWGNQYLSEIIALKLWLVELFTFNMCFWKQLSCLIKKIQKYSIIVQFVH